MGIFCKLHQHNVDWNTRGYTRRSHYHIFLEMGTEGGGQLNFHRQTDTFLRCSSMPGRIIMTDTMVPSISRKENASRLTVELYADGQHDDRRQEAEPHKQDAWVGKESQPGLSCTFPYYETLGSLGREDNQGNACTACKHSGWEQTKQTHKRQRQNGGVDGRRCHYREISTLSVCYLQSTTR